jgi:ribosome-associated toxin RatA of RatAB toxin-antitoxin module
MFELVSNVNDYSKFLPWCGESKELSRDNDVVMGTVTIHKGAINKSFTTSNRLQKNKLIEMQLVDGPFKHLHGFWRFDELKGNASKISLDLDFEFSSKWVDLAIGPVFNQIANTLVDSFVDRAREIYGQDD